VSAKGLEPLANGLKGQPPENASPIQWPTRFAPVHWTGGKESALDAILKVCQC
jgi:hypothetical protein